MTKNDLIPPIKLYITENHITKRGKWPG